MHISILDIIVHGAWSVYILRMYLVMVVLHLVHGRCTYCAWTVYILCMHIVKGSYDTKYTP